MEEFRKILEPIFTFSKQKRKSYRTQEMKDLIALVCIHIQRKYVILPPTERNLEIVKNLNELFPNVEIINECDVENRITIEMGLSINKELRERYPNVDNLVKKIKKNTIIIKKHEDLDEYIDAMKLGSKLSNGKKYILKQINYNVRSNPYFDGNNGIVKLLRYEYKLINNRISIENIGITNDGMFYFACQIENNLNFKIDDNNTRNKKDIKEIKKTIINQALEYAEYTLPFSWLNSETVFTTVELPKELQNNFKYYYYSDLKLEFLFKRKSSVNKFYTRLIFRKIPSEEFMDFLLSTIHYEKERAIN